MPFIGADELIVGGILKELGKIWLTICFAELTMNALRKLSIPILMLSTRWVRSLH